MTAERSRQMRTLWMVGVLHAFTHVYNVALLPLYLPMQADFHLTSESGATALVTVLMVSYFLPSYPMGVLADRFNRKRLLWVGLLINGLGFVGLALAPTYAVAVGCVVIAGFGGSFYHPSATSLIARRFPVNTGRALGWVGIGASAGFLVGPLYTGWHTEWSGNWRWPVMVLGLAGVVAALLFAWFAEDVPPAVHDVSADRPRPRLSRDTVLMLLFVTAAVCFSLRDYAGNSMGTLGSLFLQHAHSFHVQKTGLALSGLFLMGVLSNPLFGHLSDRGRLRWLCGVLLVSAVLVALFPHVPRRWVVPTLMAYGFFFMGSFPMVEAALMESVPDAVRGRVFGFFITVGGFVGNLAHWFGGVWVKKLGLRAAEPAAYGGIYLALAGCVVVSLAGLPLLHLIRLRCQATSAETRRLAGIVPIVNAD